MNLTKIVPHLEGIHVAQASYMELPEVRHTPVTFSFRKKHCLSLECTAIESNVIKYDGLQSL